MSVTWKTLGDVRAERLSRLSSVRSAEKRGRSYPSLTNDMTCSDVQLAVYRTGLSSLSWRLAPR